MGQMVERYRLAVHDVAAAQRVLRGGSFTSDHVVQQLSLGFWAHMLTARYDQLLWQGGVFRSFPHVPKGVTREDVFLKVDQLRSFRNKVAHHFAIYDQQPSTEYRNLMELVGMICPETEWLIRELANPARVLQARPR